ncbi:hypothetical protein F5I97DRAFT_1926687 [Phlebopus sp. FC_14]|nr:hypothetical protein F5I97DRAFT_1926687 [Phlebopus sp. FC_14]
MPSRKNRNAARQSVPEPVTYYRPLLQLDNSPSWTPESPPLLQLDRPPDSDVQSDFIHEVVPEDQGPPVKHAGRLVSVTPSPDSPPSPAQPEQRTLSPPPRMTQGHTRSPVLAREPTMLENFSRTVRSYVPTSIPVPTAAPSPPRVSRPVSFGSFNVANPGITHTPSVGHNVRTSPGSDEVSSRASGHQPSIRMKGTHSGSTGVESALFGSEDEDVQPENPRLTAYPTVGEGDTILWSRWDMLTQPNSKPLRILFVGYNSGFQIWDCTNLGSVSEMLNLSGHSWGRVTFAALLTPPPVADDAQLRSLRPLIGVISRSRGQSIMTIYSLRSHEVVKRLPFRSVSSFASSSHFTVISTTNPPVLHVLSSASLTILHTIPSSSILPYRHTPAHKPSTNSTVSLSNIDSTDFDTTEDDLLPIYSLSHRLLAFASQPPRPDSPHGAALQPRTHVRAISSNFGISQADLGSAAIKVGGTVLSGMKSLGGMAFNAAAEYAKSRSGAHPPHSESRTSAKEDRPPVISGVSNLFFSRSAPAASGNHHANPRGGSTTPLLRDASASPHKQADGKAESWTSSKAAQGFYVKVLDLAPLMDHKVSSPPQPIAEFVAAKHQPISHLKFTHDGNSLIAGPKDGQVVRLFQIRPSSLALRAGPSSGARGSGVGSASMHASPSSSSEEDAPWHIYNLRRGRTSAVIESIEISPDGRWVAVGTGKRTVHIFAINPYGGQPDLRSHTHTRIWNVDKPQPLSTELTPIVRLRCARATGADGTHSGLSFTFLSGDVALPSSLLPAPPGIASSPSTSSGRSELSFSHPQRLQNFKDVLLFDSSGGVLSLRRITIEQRSRDSAPFSSPIANIATSISLPGVGGAGRLSVSPPGQTPRDTRKSGLTQQLIEASADLVGRESTVATWQLNRRHDWGEVKHVVRETNDCAKPTLVNSLAHAELSTCSKSRDLVPRSIYLSHQFLFYTLGEDYHALIRRHHLHMTGDKIEVRKEVEASAYASILSDDAFPILDTTTTTANNNNTTTHDLGRTGAASSSFDEPLASAMSADLASSHPPGRSPIPMFPNGTPGSFKPRSSLAGVGTSIPTPIRSVTAGIAEGVGEGFGRIRRGVRQVRSPPLPRSVSSLAGQGRSVGGDGAGAGVGAGAGDGVPLEFDEQDEDFPTPRDRMGSGVGPSTSSVVGDAGDDLWRTWTEEDKLAVDEAEQFDDVVGFLDEDQTLERRRIAVQRRRW